MWLVIYCLVFLCSSFASLNRLRFERRGWNFLLQARETCPRLVHQFEFLFNSLPKALTETDFYRVHTNLEELRSLIKKSLYAFLNYHFFFLSPVFYFLSPCSPFPEAHNWPPPGITFFFCSGKAYLTATEISLHSWFLCGQCCQL